MPTRCVLCSDNNKSAGHLLFECKYSITMLLAFIKITGEALWLKMSIPIASLGYLKVGELIVEY